MRNKAICHFLDFDWPCQAEIKTRFAEKIDKEMGEYLNQCYDTEEAKSQIRTWKELSEREEANSRMIWECKSDFFSSDNHLLPVSSRYKSMPHNFNQPFQDKEENVSRPYDHHQRMHGSINQIRFQMRVCQWSKNAFTYHCELISNISH